MKVHGGQKYGHSNVFFVLANVVSRAGVHPESQEFLDLIQSLLSSSAVSIHGFYSHASNSYGSTSLSEASSFLSGEVQIVNRAAELALKKIAEHPNVTHCTQPFVLSVGSTPTAHAAGGEALQSLSKILHGSLELHAGI